MISSLVLLIECIIMAFLQASGVEGRPVEFIAVCIGLFSIVYFWEIGRNRRIRPVSVPLALGYALRIGLLFFDLYGKSIYILPNSGSDSWMFYEQGMNYARFGRSSRESSFVYLLGWIFRWVGYSRMYAQFLLMLCSVFALHLANRIMEETDIPQRQRVSAMYYLSLMPNFAILSSILLRESIVVMLISISLLCFTKWMKGRTEPWFWMAFTFAFCAAAFHSGSVAVAVGYILVRFLYNQRRRDFLFTWKNIVPAVVFLMAFLYLYNNYGDQLFSKMLGVDSVDDIASGVGKGGSTYAAYVGDSSTVLNMVLYTPLRVVYFLFSPFPWQWRGLSDIIAFCFNSLFYLWTVIRAFSYLNRRFIKNREMVIAFLIIAICTLFVFGWGVSNTGTAVRHRDKMVILYGVLWAMTKKPSVKYVQPKPIQNRR